MHCKLKMFKPNSTHLANVISKKEFYSSFYIATFILAACGKSENKNEQQIYKLIDASTLDGPFGPYDRSIHFIGDSDDDNIKGSFADDKIHLGYGKNGVEALPGDDEIYLQSWGNYLNAGPGFDSLFVQLTSPETIFVDLDNYSMSQGIQSLGLKNELRLFEKIDMSNSVANVDFLSTTGLKILQLGAGDDLVSINLNLDYVDAGLGSDTIVLRSPYLQQDVKIDLDGGIISILNSENESVSISGFENVQSNGNIPVTLVGDANDNILAAGGGSDKLYGAAGNDILSGGANSDTFIFTGESVIVGLDRILDFQSGTGGDVIKFDFGGKLTSTGSSFRNIDLSIETKKTLGTNSDILLITGTTFENELQVLEKLNGDDGLYELRNQLNDTAQICLWENSEVSAVTISIIQDTMSDGDFADKIINVAELSGFNQSSFQELSLSNFDII